MKSVDKNSEELNKPVTLGVLLEYADDFLIPKMAEVMDEKIGLNNETLVGKIGAMMDEKINKATAKLPHDLKSYIDEKLANYTSDIFIRLDQKYQKEVLFKAKVVELFKKHSIGSGEDIAFLEGLARGQ